MKYTRDDNPNGLVMEVTSVGPSDLRFGDNEPFAEKVTLKCGHHFVNTYGNINMRKFHVGGMQQCKYCTGKEKK